MAGIGTYKPVDYFSKIKGNMKGSMGTLSPDDLTYFEQQRRRIRNQYLQSAGEIKHQGTSLANDYARSKRDLTTQFGRGRGGVSAPFAQNGLLHSGLYQKALTDYAIDKNNAFSDLLAKYTEQQGAMKNSLGNLLSTYKSSMDDVASAEAARRATAEAIRIAQNGSF